MIDRKEFLRLLALGGASFLGVPTSLFGTEEIKGGPVTWGRLKFLCEGGDKVDWSVHPHGDMNLVEQITGKTTANIGPSWNVADVAKLDRMTEFPLLFMHAEREPDLDSAARANLREYLLRGGFLYAEDCVIGNGGHGNNSKNDFFFQKMIEELPRILPEAKLERLPKDHPIFHAFYSMPNGLPHMQGTPHGAHGLTLNGRLVAFLSPSDNHCAWTNGQEWFGAEKTQAALKMGANVYVYAMTQNA